MRPHCMGHPVDPLKLSLAVSPCRRCPHPLNFRDPLPSRFENSPLSYQQLRTEALEANFNTQLQHKIRFSWVTGPSSLAPGQPTSVLPLELPHFRPRPWGLRPDGMPRYKSGYGNSLFMTVPCIRDIRAAQLCLPPGKVPMFSVSQATFPQSITSHRPYKLEAERHG